MQLVTLTLQQLKKDLFSDGVLMLSTVKLIQQTNLRPVLIMMAVFYILVCVFSVIAVYQTQNSQHHTLEVLGFNDQELKHYASIPALSNSYFGRLAPVPERFSRQLAIANSHWYLNFQQPIYIVFSSPLLLFFTLLLLLTGLVLRHRLQRQIDVILKPLKKLESWSNTTVTQGITNELAINMDESSQETNVISLAIKKLQQQIHDDIVSDIASDQSIRASVLLDQETHIGNRAFFDNRLQAFLKEEDAQGAVLLIHFKELELVQNLYGYQQAMMLLSTLVQVTKQRLKSQPSYFIARHSDYELSVLLPGVFIQEVEKLTDRLLKNLQTVVTPIGINQEEFVHIGISYFRHDQDPYQIMSEADMALRSAQLQGPAQWFMFAAGELEAVKAKGSLKWRTFLTAAIADNRFVIFSQPVIACDGVEVLHREVFSKVRDKNGVLTSARVFLPMAKKCGLTVKIDLLILEQVCQMLADEQVQHNCSINISIDSLLSNEFSEQFLSIVNRFKAVKGRLMIEISEYQLVNHLGKLPAVLANLSHNGIKIIADKVGQYVVSAHYINVYTISAMKLHCSIVIDIDKKIENQVFIQSLKPLAAAKNIPIYALGVEKHAEWRTLLQLGVKGGQGHFFTEPEAQVVKASHLA